MADAYADAGYFALGRPTKTSANTKGNRNSRKPGTKRGRGKTRYAAARVRHMTRGERKNQIRMKWEALD
jgi:hypothetical protein